MMVAGQQDSSVEDYVHERAWSMAKRLSLQLTQVAGKEIELPIEEVRKIKAQFVATLKELNSKSSQQKAYLSADETVIEVTDQVIILNQPDIEMSEKDLTIDNRPVS
jgi:hypothetical protein